MKVGPIEGHSELPRHRALRVGTVATQIAPGHAPAQRKDCGKQHHKKLPLRLTDIRHLLQYVTDNCHRLQTACGGVAHSHSSSLSPFSLLLIAQKMSEVLIVKLAFLFRRS